MTPLEIPDDLIGQIDDLLARSQVFVAVTLFRNAIGCSIADAKCAIGTRFRERFPDQFSTYTYLSADGL